ncbi:MAG TPA: multiheme c-type cytochrome [Bdellovibrionota bacterium]
MKFSPALLGAILLAGCSQSIKPDARKIRVFYNNDNFAYLETCGCRVSPIGGMDRRWNAMKAYPDDSRVFLDSGNLLFKSATASEFLAPQWFQQAAGVVEAYNLLGADAVEVGETEFALGLEKFEELTRQAKFPFISANVFRKGDSSPYLRESVLLHRQGKKIGVFGLFGTGLQLPAQLEARDTLPIAKKMVKRLRADGAQMVIALTHQGYDADLQLAREVSGIDLIVGGHSQSLIQKPDQEKNALIVQLSNQGQMLGMVEYLADDLPKTRSNFVVAELNADFNEGPSGLANPMKSLVAVTNLRIQETTKGIEEKIWQERDKQITKSSFETYVSCRDCHAGQQDFHAGKPHSAAFLTLMAKHKETHLDCVKCHSVGLGQGGFDNLANAFRDAKGEPVPLAKIRKLAGKGFPKADVSYRSNPGQLKADVEAWDVAMKKAGVRKAFVSVQCENCHGSMPGHPFSEFHPKPVTVNACVQCHTKEQAPAWYGKDGKLLMDKAQSALDSMKCPK